MKARLSKVVVAGLMMSITNMAIAAGWASGTVGTLGIHNVNSTAYLSLNGTAIGNWGCSASGQFRFDTSTTQGKIIYSQLLAAKMAGAMVYLYHNDACFGGYPTFGWMESR